MINYIPLVKCPRCSKQYMILKAEAANACSDFHESYRFECNKCSTKFSISKNLHFVKEKEFLNNV